QIEGRAAGVTGQWSLDEGQGLSAASANRPGDVLALRNTSWAQGRFGPGALRFSGGPAANGSLASLNNTNYQVLPGENHPFSLSFWLNPDQLPPGWSALAGNNVAGVGWHVALHNPGPGTNF